MRQGPRIGLLGAAALMLLLGAASCVGAVEYHLQVVSLFENAFVSFLTPGELNDGASGPGLARLEATLDRGDMPRGVILFDRRVQPVSSNTARAYGGAPVTPRLDPAGVGHAAWDEITWQGNPGERSVWIVLPTLRNIQQVYNVALRSTGPLRHFQPYSTGFNGTRARALLYPLNFLWFHEERGTAWTRYISRSLDLDQGVGVVVGVNFNPVFPDQVYLIVSQAEQPTTYKAVLVWRERNLDRESPSIPGPMIVR
jgi:hypothetical protein